MRPIEIIPVQEVPFTDETPVGVSMEKAATLLGLSVTTVRKLANEGKLPHNFAGKKRVFSYKGLQEFVKGVPTK
jgi:excisionase family DNA binding protein